MGGSESIPKNEMQSGVKRKTAPYDEQNTADYHEMSKRIAAALELMEHDTEIPATEKELARLANCSRGTLRNRGYPLVRLRMIKQMRTANKTITTSQSDSCDARKNVVDDRKKLLDDLKASRTEAARWFTKCKELEAERARERRAREVLVSEKNALLTRIEQIERSQHNFLNPKSDSFDDSISRVVPFERST